MCRPSSLLAAIALLGGLATEGPPGRTVLRQEFRQAQSGMFAGAVSEDGRHVAFVSSARLLPEDTNDVDDIYVLDRASQRLTVASVGYPGTRANGTS